jgi:hypothetical protein
MTYLSPPPQDTRPCNRKTTRQPGRQQAGREGDDETKKTRNEGMKEPWIYHKKGGGDGCSSDHCSMSLSSKYDRVK